jgi:hypothetical protein
MQFPQRAKGDAKTLAECPVLKEKAHESIPSNSQYYSITEKRCPAGYSQELREAGHVAVCSYMASGVTEARLRAKFLSIEAFVRIRLCEARLFDLPGLLHVATGNRRFPLMSLHERASFRINLEHSCRLNIPVLDI